MSITDGLKKNPLILLAVLLAAHLALVSLGEAPGHAGRRFIQVWILAVFAPAQSVVTNTTGGVSGVWKNYFSLRDARQENETLRAENAQLKSDLTRAQEAQQRLTSLEALLNLKQTRPFEKVTAQVVGRDANQWFNSVSIDRGTFSGIAENQPVITPEGLVGRVIHAAPNAARVMLITDERHGTGAVIGQLADSRVLGVVKGKNSSLCEMKVISGDAQIQVGEKVLTSGQDGIYPKGLVIGTVARIDAGAGGNPLAVEIKPAAPLAKLDLVSVLLITREQLRASLDELDQSEKEKLEREKRSRTGGPKK